MVVITKVNAASTIGTAVRPDHSGLPGREVRIRDQGDRGLWCMLCEGGFQDLVIPCRHMQVGGNANAQAFFKAHGCTTNDAKTKYSSRAAQLYKAQVEQRAKALQKKLGTKLFEDPAHKDTEEEEESSVYCVPRF